MPERVAGNAYDARLMRRLWQFAAPHWRLLAIALILIPLATGFELAQPYLLGIAIDQHIRPATLDGLGTIVLFYVLFVLLQSFSGFAQQYAIQLLGQKSMHNLRVAIYSHVTKQRMSFFDHTPVGQLLTRMTNDVESINEMFATGVVTLIADVIKLIAIVSIMTVRNAELTLVTFAVLPVLVLLVNYARKLMRTSFRTVRTKLAAMNAYVQEYLSGLRVVQLFRREQKVVDGYNEINAGFRNAYLKAIRADASMYAGVEAVATVSVACILWYSSGRMADGALTVGLIVVFIEYVHKFFIPVRDLSAKYTVMQSAMAAAERIVDLLDTNLPDAPTLANIASTKTNSNTDITPPQAVEFQHVGFAYRNNEPVLKDVSLAVPPGQTLAVVGTTGSGKSTLMKLLTRLYDHQSGNIFVKGRNIQSLTGKALRKLVTVVSQDVFLFPGTVADNVRMGDLQADDAAVHHALSQVGALEILARKNADATTAVLERGANFSAGERQLIAFARALIRQPEILVLDEATAHVDPETEERIETALEILMKHRTTLVIAHRLSTIRNAHQIAVMSHGHIVEFGSHAQLISQEGVYAQLERTFSRTLAR